MASRSSHHSHVPIQGSEYIPLQGAKALGPVDPLEHLTVTVVVRPRRPAPSLHDDSSLATLLPRDRQYLSRDDFEARHGSHPDDFARIQRFAREHGLEVVETSPIRHAVVLQGTAADLSEAFHVEMVRYDHHRGSHRGINGPVQIPKELAACVSAVLGLHDRPAARRHLPATAPKRAHIPSPAPFHPSAVASAYRFPQHADGTGQCIGIIELGGGYYRSDLEKFFAELKLSTPHISDVSVHGAKNSPADRAALAKFMTALTSGGKGVSAIKQLMSATDPKSRREADLLQSTVETTMDIEIAAAFAPGARIVVYFAHNSEQGIYNALTAALADKRHRPNVLSLSWGEPEPGVSPNYMALIDSVLKNLAHIGVTVCVSSGDFGAHNGSPEGKPSVNFPASSPYALGCGGTELRMSEDKVESEVVWNCVFDGMHGATGGGVSRVFDRPYWQGNFDVPGSKNSKAGRGVPDVAGVADPHSGCRILVGGVDGVSSGTSAVAPMWAALIARLNQALGAQSGYLNSLLYKFAAARQKDDAAFRAITEGENGAYRAGPGWNACTGLGSPLGDRLLAALSGPAK